MTRPLTAAEPTAAQKVALDAMREAWPTEVVERMLRAVEPDIEHALLRLNGLTFRDQVDDGGVCLFCGVWRGYHGHTESHEHEDHCALMIARYEANATAAVVARSLPVPMPLSPPETPAATSTPHLPGETPDVCHNCARHPCYCDSFPGHGAG